MLARLAHTVIRRRKLVLVGAAMLFALSGSFGGKVSEELSSGGFNDPASESFQADQALLDTFGTGTPNLVLVFTAGAGASVDDPAMGGAGLALAGELAAEPHVTNVVSYWSLDDAPPLKGINGDRA